MVIEYLDRICDVILKMKLFIGRVIREGKKKTITQNLDYNIDDLYSLHTAHYLRCHSADN